METNVTKLQQLLRLAYIKLSDCDAHKPVTTLGSPKNNEA